MQKGETKEARLRRVQWLESVVAEVDSTGCREWPWSKTPKGYGRIRWNSKTQYVGHVVLELSGRPRTSSDDHQLHSCDNPSCVAPWHLRWGTNQENRDESIARGRHFTKLTPDQVLVIYRSTERQRDVAAMFGVTQRVVWQIKHGHTWSRVTGHVRHSGVTVHDPIPKQPGAMWLSISPVPEEST